MALPRLLQAGRVLTVGEFLEEGIQIEDATQVAA